MYAWEVGLRSVAAPLWVLNSVLGLIAALNTWDFTGSLQSPLSAVMQDPRLVAQMVLLVGVAILILLHWLVLEKRVHKAIADIVFVVFGVVLLSDIFLDPAKRALHPDSPVLNSGSRDQGAVLRHRGRAARHLPHPRVAHQPLRRPRAQPATCTGAEPESLGTDTTSA